MNITTANSLIDAYKRLPPLPANCSDNIWCRHRREFRNHVENGDVDEFLRWSTSALTIFVGSNPFVKHQYNELLNRPDWDYYHKALTIDQSVGNPSYFVSNITGNFINQCYHLSKIEDATGKRIAEFDTIVEFGGGYGALRLISHALGFTGDYYIYDLPELSLLQEYYLAQYGCPTVLEWVDDNDSFPAPPMGTDLLVGLYSLSEVNRQLRETFISATRASNIVLASQNVFEGVDMIDELSGMAERLNENRWWFRENKYIPKHFYVIGKRR